MYKHLLDFPGLYFLKIVFFFFFPNFVKFDCLYGWALRRNRFHWNPENDHFLALGGDCDSDTFAAVASLEQSRKRIPWLPRPKGSLCEGEIPVYAEKSVIIQDQHNTQGINNYSKLQTSCMVLDLVLVTRYVLPQILSMK